MSVAKSVVLRHREPGYLRFDIPDELRTSFATDELRRALSATNGIYRVGIQPSAGKLSIRFHDAFCSFEQVVRLLFSLVRQIIAQSPSSKISASRAVVSAGPRVTLTSHGLFPAAYTQWLQEKWLEIKETLLALRIMANRALGQRPRWTKEFMNDLLMLFLIKLHWHQILTEWMPRPWTYRYEWMATIYMIYLSVQARIPQAA